MTVDPRQIRAARALLNWSQADLAEASGVARSSIKNIENEITVARRDTLRDIQDAFENCGLEFLPGSGVRFKQNNIEIFEGADRFDSFYDFMYEHLKKQGGEVCFSVYDEHLTAKHRKNPEIHRNRMKDLAEQKKITFRILTTKSDFLSHGYAEFRCQPQESPTLTGFYAFGDCLALLSFVRENAPYVIVIQSAPLAEGYRQGFNIAWDKAGKPFVKK